MKRIKIIRQCRTIVLVVLSVGVYSQHAQSEDSLPWEVSGDISTRSEFIDIRGDSDNATLNNDGDQHFTNINLLTNRQFSRYERLEGRLAAVANDSSFRQEENGVIAERLSLRWEKSDRRLPFRLELGDFYGYSSHRTLQRNLKGIQFEVQSGNQQRRQSWQWFWGNPQSDYKDIDFNDDLFYGASWLLESRSGLALNSNLVVNRQEPDNPINGDGESVTTLGVREQRVLSFGINYRNQWLGQKWEYEGEVGYMDGEGLSEDDDARRDTGLFLRVGSRDPRGFDYGLRFDRYGEDYQPAGATISANRQSLQTHFNWRRPGGQTWRFRLQDFTDALESDTPIDTTLLGVDYQTRINKAALNIRSFAQNVTSNNSDRDSYSLSGDLSFPVSTDMNVRANLNLTGSKDKLNDQDDRRQQAGLSVNRRLTLAGRPVTASLGVNYQNNDSTNGGDSRNWNPVLNLNWKGRHQSLSLSFNQQQQRFQQDIDTLNRVRSQRLALRYGFARGPHNLGIEWGQDDRNAAGDETATERFSLNYSYRFNRKRRSAELPEVTEDYGLTDRRELADYRYAEMGIAGLPLGGDMIELLARLQQDGVDAPYEQPPFIAFDVKVIPDLNERQQLVLEQDSLQRLKRAILIFELPSRPIAATISDSEAFGRILDYFVSIHGSPDDSRDDGGLIIDDANDALNQTYQWEIGNGRVLRLGIPLRLDGQLRIEAHVMSINDIGSFDNLSWGLDEFVQ